MHGPEFYDDDAVHAVYTASRERPDNPNDTLEQPVLRELAGNLTDRRVLELGCGAGAFGRYAIDAGCRSYLGIDGSRNMVAQAREELAGTDAEIVHAALETWPFPVNEVDVVVSSLTLHYFDDLGAILRQVYDALAGGGRFVFSVEHPVITSSDEGWGSGQRQSWLVDDYFEIGARETSWLGGRVIKYHRTVETYFSALQAAGFLVDGLRESNPERERFADPAEYERRKRIPLFLFLRGVKSGDSI